MRLLMKAEGKDVTMRAEGPVGMTRQLASSLLRAHARLIGRLVNATGGAMAPEVRSMLSHAYLAVMGGQSPAGQGSCRADVPISIIYDTKKEDAHFVAADGKLPGNPAGALILMFVRLTEILAGDIEYASFSARILESFDKGTNEDLTTADKAKED